MRAKWSSAYVFQWTPILTFARRRAQLLEWLEAHTEPVAFSDSSESIGISLVNPDLRLVIARSHMHVEVSNHISTPEALMQGLVGMFEVLEPEDVTQSHATMLVTHGLGHLDYNEARARFAARLVGPRVQSFRPLDASALADIDSHDWSGQVEWGVVEPAELIMRLQSPDLGRLNKSRPPVRDIRLVAGEDLPPSTLLVDVSLRRQVGGSADSPGMVLSRIAEVDSLIATFVDEMHEIFEEGGSGEFAQA